eukprot:comp6647_c0_seq1/m.2421 comp6647_c0_seq1/g.2421  ORF comp6647_c0_seq1/g.2421 comp6647_c0_seq1/m.2421 type:complete len:319 (-) comp6647_c0_seq1:154-1110(-)
MLDPLEDESVVACGPAERTVSRSDPLAVNLGRTVGRTVPNTHDTQSLLAHSDTNRDDVERGPPSPPYNAATRLMDADTTGFGSSDLQRKALFVVLSPFFLLGSPLLLMYLSMTLQWCFFPNLPQYGILPRTWKGLRGIPLCPFIHTGWHHLVANTWGFVTLGVPIALRGSYQYLFCTGFIILAGGFITWLIGRFAFVVGASGLDFGYWSFNLSVLIWERPFKIRNLLFALVTGFLYGGWISAAFPGVGTGISWEAHLGGLIAGVLAAYLNSKYVAPLVKSKEEHPHREMLEGQVDRYVRLAEDKARASVGGTHNGNSG